jgi:hypothetical protein
MERFYVGLHQPSDGKHFDHACFNWGRLADRKSHIGPCKVILDSRAFTELFTFGYYRHDVEQHAEMIRHACTVANVEIAVAQDFMCEDAVLAKTHLSVFDHQNMTITRYDELLAQDLPCPIMPVLQGYSPGEYVQHIKQYGDRLKPGAWVGVGSVCKRNANPLSVYMVLTAINFYRPDLRLHGFGLKRTALELPEVREMLFSADSTAWSFAARHEGRNRNDWREAARYAAVIEEMIAGDDHTGERRAAA